MKKSISLIAGISFIVTSYAQTPEVRSRVNQYADFAATVGQSQGSLSLSYVHNWKLWKKRRWEAGFSLRWSNYFGEKTSFITAPAKLARTNTTPFIIFFAGQRTETQDTLTVQRPFVSALNLALNFGYNFTEKFSAGFNIDLIGFTIGSRSPAILVSEGETQTEPSASPANFNLLLTGDHDLGTLNSEFFLKYKFNRWAIRGIYQFLFVEYVTESVKQIAPDGSSVFRFRNKANTFGLGVSYHF